MSNPTFIKSSGNVFKDVGFKNSEAKKLKLLSRLMNLIVYYIQHEGLTQKQAAIRLGVSQPRISNLVHGKIDLFSIGMLLDMAERAGFPIYKKIESDTEKLLTKYEGSHDHI